MCSCNTLHSKLYLWLAAWLDILGDKYYKERSIQWDAGVDSYINFYLYLNKTKHFPTLFQLYIYLVQYLFSTVLEDYWNKKILNLTIK